LDFGFAVGVEGLAVVDVIIEFGCVVDVRFLVSLGFGLGARGSGGKGYESFWRAASVNGRRKGVGGFHSAIRAEDAAWCIASPKAESRAP
jgi:hypothetical protein